MTESTERPLYTIMGLIITVGVTVLILYLYFMQRALGMVTETKQMQEFDKLLGAVMTTCGDTNHPTQELYVTVYGSHEIAYHRSVADFGSTREKNIKRAGCNKNCLCAFSGDTVVQCVSMFDQTSAYCQDINIQESHWPWDQDLGIPYTTLIGLPEYTCKFKLKVRWDGGSSPNRVVIESLGVERLAYTTGHGSWLAEADCAF